MSSTASFIVMVSSTGFFVVLLGGLVLTAVRSNRRTKRLQDELDKEVPKVAELAQRRHQRKYGKSNTKLNLIINESFSGNQRQR